MAIRTNAEVKADGPAKLLAAAQHRVRVRAAKQAAAVRKAKEKAARDGKPKPRRVKKVTPRPTLIVHLTTRHVLGNRAYGPGTVEVPEDTGRVLQEGESRVAVAERRLFQDRAFIIGNGNVVREVDPASFADAMARM